MIQFPNGAVFFSHVHGMRLLFLADGIINYFIFCLPSIARKVLAIGLTQFLFAEPARGRYGTTQSKNKQFCKRRLSTYTQYAGSSFNYGAEPRIKNLQTWKIVYRWNSNLHIHHCGDPFSIFFLYDKIRQLEPGNSDVFIWKIPPVKFVFESAEVARPSSDPLIEPATSFSSPIFRTHPHAYNFFIKFYPYGIGPATGKCASILFTLFPGDYDNLLKWPFSKIIHIGIRDRLDPLNTWMKTIRPDQDPAYKKPTMSTKTGAATVLINNFIPRSKLFSETEGFLIDGASFIEIKFSDPPVLKPHTQTSLLFPFP